MTDYCASGFGVTFDATGYFRSETHLVYLPSRISGKNDDGIKRKERRSLSGKVDKEPPSMFSIEINTDSLAPDKS